ncbi:cellobiose phosphorylase [Anaerobacterium chartisolvens]|uniref:Cellobiose phosphorylase n=1 Tax=Anaerobacterium chartisolvens TaxID=1297424 RepID=A0A369BAK2_9FIRM|nr:glycosyl transferase [Anaerobacterium chartisolvens]RCX17547.1 cellobiose phosphorylase [Anaerobacterium chartisolvens]
MKYGYFNDESKEYVITSAQTPYPWNNYLGTKDFFSVVSNTSGGYCFYRDARLTGITRRKYRSIPLCYGGRCFHIYDNGDLWCPGFVPANRDLDYYMCRHGMGYTSLVGERNGIRSEALFFVPLDTHAEIQKVTLTNTGKENKKISVFSYIKFGFRDYCKDTEYFKEGLGTGEVQAEDSVIYYKIEYGERRTRYAFYSVNIPVSGFITDKDIFTGCSGISCDAMEAPVASHCINVELAPGEAKTIIFILGYAENDTSSRSHGKGAINKKKAHKIIKAFETEEQADVAFTKLAEHWGKLLSKYTLKSGDQRLDRMVNIWSQYQCMVDFNMSGCSLPFEPGLRKRTDFGDLSRDILGFVHQIPDRARERILDLASVQVDGADACNRRQTLAAEENNEVSGELDLHPLWLILSTSAYIKETGNFDILEEKVPSIDDRRKAISLFGHLTKAFYSTAHNLGPNGFPVVGQDAWGDCLNFKNFPMKDSKAAWRAAGRKGKASESALVAGMFVFIGDELVKICRHIGWDTEASEASRHIKRMKENLISRGYREECFLRAYDNMGNTIESKELRELLCRCNSWTSAAEAVTGNGDRAFEYYCKTAPAYIEDISDLHISEPYVYSQTIEEHGAEEHGAVKSSWLPSTAAWNFVVISQWILGIRPAYNGLMIDPCIPSSWNEYTVKRWYRDSMYEITVKNPEHVCRGLKSLMVDGKKFIGNMLPVFGDKKLHKVEAILGND